MAIRQLMRHVGGIEYIETKISSPFHKVNKISIKTQTLIFSLQIDTHRRKKEIRDRERKRFLFISFSLVPSWFSTLVVVSWKLQSLTSTHTKPNPLFSLPSFIFSTTNQVQVSLRLYQLLSFLRQDLAFFLCSSLSFLCPAAILVIYFQR